MDSNSDECWANMAINLSLESKDAINWELIRTIHKAPELTFIFFPAPDMFVDQSQKKKVFVFLTVKAELQGEPGGGQAG